MQTVPSWPGWLSKTDNAEDVAKSIVEYMAPLKVSINGNSTVHYI